MKNIKIAVIMSFTLLYSAALLAQQGRGRNSHYRPNNHYYYQPDHYSVNRGPRYSYPPNYRPYYGPSPMYRPVYSRPSAYVHFGPVFGLRINVLPFGYSRIYVGSNPYYYNDGVYYRPNNNNQYEVVAPPLNATVKKLPANAVLTMIDGQKYYQVGGTFYQEEFDENNNLSYRVVGTDGVINTADANNGDDLNARDNVNENTNDNANANDNSIPTPGSRYDNLPAESRVQVINQQKYFVSPGGIYYKEVIEGDKVRYEVTTVQ